MGPWIPIGMSSNNKNIQLDEILLTWLYFVTDNIPYRHAAVACGMKRSKICKICQLVPRILKENGFIKEFIRLPPMGEALRSARIVTERSGLPSMFWAIIDGTHVEVYKRQNFALELTFKIELECYDSGQSRRYDSCIEG